MIPTSTEWDALANVPGDIIAVARLFYGDGTNYVRVAEEDVVIDGEYYIGALKSVLTVVSNMDWRKHTSSVGGGQIRLINSKWDRLERPSDLVEDTSLGSGSDIGFYGRVAEIKFFRKGISSWANCFPHYKGIMEPIGHDRDVFVIAVTDKGEALKERKVGGEKITGTDLTDYGQTQGDGELNESKPSVFGDKKNEFCHIDATLTDFLRPRDMFKMRFLGTKTLGETIYQISDKQIDFEDTASYRIYAKDSTIDRFVELHTDDWEIVQNDERGCIIQVDATPRYWDYRLAISTTVSEDDGGDGTGTVTNEGNMVDQDNATSGTLFTSGSELPGAPHARVTVTYEVMTDPDVVAAGTFQVFARSSYSKIGEDEPDFEINGIDASGNSAANYNQYGMVANGDSTVLLDLTGAPEAGTGFEQTAIIYMSYLRFEYGSSGKLDHFAACGGREYGDWINGRTGHADNNAAIVKISGTDLSNIGGSASPATTNFRSATGGLNAAGVAAGDILILDDAFGINRIKVKSKTNDTDLVVYGFITDTITTVDFSILTPAVVDNPVGAVEMIVRDYGGLVDADVDESVFNDASVDVGSLVFAAGIVSGILLPRALAEIGETFGLYPFWGGANQYKCVVMKAIYTANDVVQDIPYGDMKKFDFKKRTPRVDLAVSSVLEYGWNGDEFVARTDGVESSANVTKYGVDLESAVYELNSRFLSDDVSAVTQETYNLNLRMQPHNMPMVGLGLLYLALETGDIISLSELVDADGIDLLVNGEDVDQVSYTRNSQTIYGMFMVMGFKRNRRIDLDGFQLHRLS